MLPMTDIERAEAAFRNGVNCSQAILSTYGPRYGLDDKTSLRIALGFGAGMGRLGSTCGAVTGAFMVLGLKHASENVSDNERKEKTYAAVREFARRFEARNGSLDCKELLGCDLGTPEGMKQAKEKDIVNAVCPKYVKDSAEILEEMLSVPKKV
jgi:C_GCAxxG_C_C family probable redox protein